MHRKTLCNGFIPSIHKVLIMPLGYIWEYWQLYLAWLICICAGCSTAVDFTKKCTYKTLFVSSKAYGFTGGNCIFQFHLLFMYSKIVYDRCCILHPRNRTINSIHKHANKYVLYTKCNQLCHITLINNKRQNII